MAKILFISGHAPTNQYPQAGQKISLQHLNGYAQSGADVDVVVVANQAEIAAAKDLSTQFSGHLYTYPLSTVKKVISCLRHFKAPLKFSSRLNEETARKIRHLLTMSEYDTVHFEYSHAAVYLEHVKSQISPKQTRIIISIHDVVFQSFLRKAQQNFLLGIESNRLFHYEKALYSQADELWVLSPKDRNILTSLFSINSNKILVVPPLLGNFVKHVKRNPEKFESKSMLFWAAMNRPENEQAVLAFVKNCFHQLIQKNSDFKLYIVGANPSKRIMSLANKQIVVTGFVEDPVPYFEKVEIGIVPLLTGAGIKLKTLEMLAAGLPVISTTVGAEGVETVDQSLFISDDFDDWVNAIETGLENFIPRTKPLETIT